MNAFDLKRVPTACAALAVCFGFAATAQAQIIVRPPILVAPQVVVPQVVIPQPGVAIVAPQPAYVVPGPAVEYVPNPLDAFVVNAAPADVVFMNGDTYVWAVDEHGSRYRRFYGHGDRREELFHRREELHHVMERNGGHLPGREGFHAEARRDAAIHREEHAAGMAHNVAMAHAAQAHEGLPGQRPGAAPGQPHPGAPGPQAHAAPALQARAAAPAPQAHAAPAPQAHAAPAPQKK